MFLATSATLGVLTFYKVDGLNPLITEVGLYQKLGYKYRFILNLDKTAEDAELISAELDLSNWLIFASEKAVRPELKNEPFVASLSELRRSEGNFFKDRDESKKRLQNLYTPAKMSELASLLARFESAYHARVFGYYVELYRLVRYLLISLSFLAMSLGFSIISSEILRQRLARNDDPYQLS